MRKYFNYLSMEKTRRNLVSYDLFCILSSLFILLEAVKCLMYLKKHSPFKLHVRPIRILFISVLHVIILGYRRPACTNHETLIRVSLAYLLHLTSWGRVLLEKLIVLSASQEIPSLSSNPKFHNRVHKRQSLDLILSQINPFTTFKPILILSYHYLTCHGTLLQKDCTHSTSERLDKFCYLVYASMFSFGKTRVVNFRVYQVYIYFGYFAMLRGRNSPVC